MSKQASKIETEVLDGLGLANQIRAGLADEINKLVAEGHRPPSLAVVLVGDDPASRSYIKGKQRACNRIGMESVEHLLPGDTREGDLLELIDQLNQFRKQAPVLDFIAFRIQVLQVFHEKLSFVFINSKRRELIVFGFSGLEKMRRWIGKQVIKSVFWL